jgi:outer membrane protein OmpA-like peptidoglycan-associated protein
MPITSRQRVGLAVVAGLLLAAGCQGGVRLRARLNATNDLIAQAERNGAYTCAPKQLALAKSHSSFTSVELDQGYLSRAKWHYGVSNDNAREAYEKSPPEKCAPRRVVVQEPGCPDPDGDGICGEADACPNEPEDFDGVEDTDGCPEDQDTDGDGLSDSADRCVIEPEDRDQYQDDDGCPELDNDLDGRADQDDRCPNEPEDPDGFEDEDGCPDGDNDRDEIADVDDRCPNTPGVPSEGGCPLRLTTVVIRDDRIEITQQIHFEYDRSVIRSQSYHILDEVVLVLQNYPAITLEVQGHTDSRGADAYNYWLSHDRANAVRTYLIEHGVDRSRLTFRGFGETCPVETNRTNAGRAANRRSVFLRTDREFERDCAVPEEPDMPRVYRRRHRQGQGQSRSRSRSRSRRR